MVDSKHRVFMAFKATSIKVRMGYREVLMRDQGLTIMLLAVETITAGVSDTSEGMSMGMEAVVLTRVAVELAWLLLVLVEEVLSIRKQGDQGATLGTPDVLVQPAIAQSSQGGGLPVSVVNHVDSAKVQNNQEADLAAKAQGKKAKKNDKLNCRRCNLPGHYFFECSAVLCDYCELADHKSDACQMLNAPKPQVIMYGHADEKLVFFEFPATQTYRTKLESSRNGLLTVTPKVEPVCSLPEIWVYMHGIPPKRKGDFLGLWGLGTLFGKTIKVDMPYTREHGVLRILIGCLDYTRIPDRMNVLVVDGFYDLSFEVEIPEGDEEMEDASLDNNGPPNDDQNKDSHSKESKDHKSADGEKNSTDNALAKDPKVSETRGSQQQTMGKGSVTTLSGISPSSRVRYSPLVQQMFASACRQLLELAQSVVSADDKMSERPAMTELLPKEGAEVVDVESDAAAADIVPMRDATAGCATESVGAAAAGLSVETLGTAEPMGDSISHAAEVTGVGASDVGMESSAEQEVDEVCTGLQTMSIPDARSAMEEKKKSPMVSCSRVLDFETELNVHPLASEGPPTRSRKRKITSDIWDDFTPIYDDDGTLVQGVIDATTIVEDLDNEDEMLRASTNFMYELGFVFSLLNYCLPRTQDLLS
ncbi:hypothetical protein ACQ4PT_026081 [Festuca glaucescens]